MTNLINHLKQLDKDATPAPLEARLFVALDYMRDTFKFMVGDKLLTPQDLELFVAFRNNAATIISLLEAGEKLRDELAAIEEEADDELGEWAAVEIPYVPSSLQTMKTISSAAANALEHYDTIKKELE